MCVVHFNDALLSQAAAESSQARREEPKFWTNRAEKCDVTNTLVGGGIGLLFVVELHKGFLLKGEISFCVWRERERDSGSRVHFWCQRGPNL